jgi:hypothetical protein
MRKLGRPEALTLGAGTRVSKTPTGSSEGWVILNLPDLDASRITFAARTVLRL